MAHPAALRGAVPVRLARAERPVRRRGGVGARAGGRRRHRSDRRCRAFRRARRPHPGFDRPWPRRHRSPHRGERAGSGRAAGLDRLRAHQRFRRAADATGGCAAFSLCRFGHHLAGPRLGAHHDHHRQPGQRARARRRARRRCISVDARPRNDRHLRRRTAHAVAAPALSLGARRVQGQRRQPDPLPGHPDRHRRPARAVPDDRVRGARRVGVSRRGRSRLGGVRLCLHRLRVLAQDLRLRRRFRADLAGRGRGDDRGDLDRLPVRLPQSAPVACALPAHRHGLAALDDDRRRPFRLQRAGRGRGRADFDRQRRRHRVAADPQPGRQRLGPRRHVDSDLVPARRLGVRGGRDRIGSNHQRPRLARADRRAGADRDADRVHDHAERVFRRRHVARGRRRRGAARARDDGMRRRDLRLERRRRSDIRQQRTREPTRPQARDARRAGRELAGRAASARSRPLRRGARWSAASALRPHPARHPFARRRRTLFLVSVEGASGDRRAGRGRSRHRRAFRRHRKQGGRGTHPARRDPRQSDRFAEIANCSSTGWRRR